MLLSVIFIIVYHHKFIRPRKTVFPQEQGMGVAYVQDIFLPAMDRAAVTRNGVGKDGMDEFVWARRVINGTPSRMLELDAGKNAW